MWIPFTVPLLIIYHYNFFVKEKFWLFLSFGINFLAKFKARTF